MVVCDDVDVYSADSLDWEDHERTRRSQGYDFDDDGDVMICNVL